MARASKPSVPLKEDDKGIKVYAAEINAFDKAHDDVIDDYVSQTDTTNQPVSSKLIFAAGKGPDALGTKKVNEAAIGDGKVPVYRSGPDEIGYEAVAGGGGAPDTPTYITKVDETAALPNSIQHENILEANKHTPKAHTHLEADVTDLDHDAAKIATKVVDLAGIATNDYLQYDGVKIVPQSAIRKSPFNFLIYASGGNYYAMDPDGDLPYKGAVFRTMMNSAIADVNGAGGGLVFIMAGDYPVTEQINLLSDVNLMGVGKPTRLYLPNGQPLESVKYTIFSSNAQSNIHISHLCLDLNIDNNGDDRGHAWWAGNGSNLYAFDVWVINCNRFGIYFTATDGGTYHNWHVHHCTFDYIHEDGCEYYISNASEVYGMSINDNYFTDILHVGAAFTGLAADEYCGGGEICNNVFDHWNPDGHWAPVDPSTQHGQAVQANGQGALVSDNTVVGFLRGFETQATNANYNQFVDNTVIGADLGGTNNYTREAFKLNNGDHNIVAYNTIIGPPTDDIGGDHSMVNIKNVDDTRFIENTLIRPAGNANTWYGFREEAGNTTNSKYRRNHFINMPLPIYYTIEPSASFDSFDIPFVHGTEAADRGWLIDAGAEYASTYITLPPNVNQVQRIKVYAVAVALEADAMRLELAAAGGSSNEAYNAETISIVDKASTTTNFAANDIIYWLFTATDDGDIDDLVGGDSVEIKVLHEAAGNGDCATNAWFRTVTIEYG